MCNLKSPGNYESDTISRLGDCVAFIVTW